VEQDSSGGIVNILAGLGELHFNLVDIYTPTNLTERKCLYKNLNDFFFPNALKIIVDFNSLKALWTNTVGFYREPKI